MNFTGEKEKHDGTTIVFIAEKKQKKFETFL